ncbi:MAG TPA: ligase-associated DNA damage response endonuclease PdeM [Ferruginibacter sp.]|nr:ligase-associated DNA damage response endonuclease PdeM [Ferruginibacter sp.]
MASFIKHTVRNNDFILHGNRTVFWEQEKALIVSDLHIGKTGHFRKSGIPVPPSVTREDMQRLVDNIQFFKPARLIIVGDLFHSLENKEHDWFLKWRNDFPGVEFILVKGNHDIIADTWYTNANITVAEKSLRQNGFLFVHHIEDVTEKDLEENYCFSGHIHPAVVIRGLGKQSLRFPCFYFTEQYAVLPAFGKFTGTYMVEPSKKEKAFAVVNNSVIQV